MTVKELMEELKIYPPDMLVYVDDYEWGAEELQMVSFVIGKKVWEGSIAKSISVVVLK